jgi:uncharacterized protein YecT (DUF1311 family)
MNVLSRTAIALLIAVQPGLAPAADNADDPLRVADQALNATYRDVMSRLTGDQRKSLLTAQRNWLGYRDTICARESALLDAEAGGGTSPMTRCLARLTVARTTELQGYGETLVAAETPPPPSPGPADLVAPAPSPPSRAPARGPLIENCSLGDLPARFTVQAVGIYEGDLDTDVRLEASGHETRGAEVVVNLPGQDVVLVLMAYDPVLWTVRRTPETRLAAVVVGGYHTQAVLGVERGLPLVITTHTGRRKDCGSAFYAYKADPALFEADARVLALTGRAIDRLWSHYRGGRIHIGPPPPSGTALVESRDYVPQDYTDLPPFPSGQKGLDRLMDMGLLRLATASDLDAWVNAASAPYRRFDPSLNVDPPSGASGTYVVLGPMEIPGGLYGAHSAAFLVPPGVPMPTGHLGHSSVYVIEDGSCRGPACPSHR